MDENNETTDTIPPAPDNHGFLEQFETLTHQSFETLKGVVEGGLQTTERVVLIKVAMKLFALSFHNVKEEDFTPEIKVELETFIQELESIHNLPFSSLP